MSLPALNNFASRFTSPGFSNIAHSWAINSGSFPALILFVFVLLVLVLSYISLRLQSTCYAYSIQPTQINNLLQPTTTHHHNINKLLYVTTSFHLTKANWIDPASLSRPKSSWLPTKTSTTATNPTSPLSTRSSSSNVSRISIQTDR